MAGVDIGRVLSSDDIARIPSSDKDAIYAALVQKLERCQSELTTCQADNDRMRMVGDPLRSYVRIADDPPLSHDARVRERFKRREDFHRRRVQYHLLIATGVVFGAPITITVFAMLMRLMWLAVLR